MRNPELGTKYLVYLILTTDHFIHIVKFPEYHVIQTVVVLSWKWYHCSLVTAFSLFSNMR